MGYIRVYKRLEDDDGELTSPFRRFIYESNKVYITTLKKGKFEITGDFLINDGFHAYVSLKSAIAGKLWDEIICEFIIPKGATYCLNCNGEVVSDGLMYTGNHIFIKEYKTYNSKKLWKEK